VRPLLKKAPLPVAAVRLLADWKDHDSFDPIAAALASTRPDDREGLLLALGEIDPAKARPLVLATLREGRGHWAFERIATREDGALLLRLLRTAPSEPIERAAGRLAIPGAIDLLLDKNAAIGLAYLGDARAVRRLAAMIDCEPGPFGNRATPYVNALDYIVNRAKYPALAERKKLQRGSLTIAEGAKQIRAAFGIDLAAASADPCYLDFNGEEDLVEVIERTSNRCAHLWRNGRVEFVKVEEAQAYWKAWWAEHAAEFK
jgi:hypothetical protein